jgi:adenosylmethionine-8-amino-7-oxononanoate aminotransferase
MAAIELASNCAAKKPIEKASIDKIAHTTYVAGATLRVSGSNIFLSPPLIASTAELRKIGDAIDLGLRTAD